MIRGRFELGRLVATQGAMEEIPEQDMMFCVGLHHNGMWGDIPEADKQENELAIKEDYRILSSYKAKTGKQFWIITEADRSYTTVMLPEEY